MARILSVSYDDTLLRTRELLLEGRGHRVVSCLGFTKALDQSAKQGFDMLVVGHSIPAGDKARIIDRFREYNPMAEVVALMRTGEARLETVDYYLNPGDPVAFLETIDRIAERAGNS